MKIRSILFDLDGTLVDSLEDLTDAVNHVRQEFALSPLSSADVRQLVGKGARNLVSRALPDCGGPEIERALQLFLDYNAGHIVDKSRLYPGVPEMLEILRTKGVRLAVISNKNESLSRLILHWLGIGHYFEFITGGDTFPENKPSPLPLLETLKVMQTKADECLMVGDSVNDIQAGNRAGIATVGCSWGYGFPEELEQSAYRANSCADLLKTIGMLEQTA